MSPKIAWIINPYDRILGEYETDGRYGTLAGELINRGHHVVWWTSDFRHSNKSKRTPLQNPVDGLEIRYLPVPPYKRNIGFDRLWNCYKYGKEFYKEALKAPQPDVIVASLPPIESAANAVRYAQPRNIPVVIDIQDIWPEAFLLPFPKSLHGLVSILLTPYFNLSARAYRGATAITGVSPQYVELGLSKRTPQHPRITSHVAYLGYDEEVFSSVQPKFSDDKVRVMFAGTLGHTYDVEAMVRAASMLAKSHPSVEFVIIGSGPLEERARSLATELGLPSSIFSGRLPFTDVVAWLKSSSIGINGYAAGAPQSFTNKICEYAGAGLAVANSLPDGLDTFIDDHAIGMNYQAGNAEHLYTILVKMIDDSNLLSRYKTNSRKIALDLFERKKVYKDFASFVMNQIS
jgi:glycosyltransferase involved in cell wall biosynthesis